MTIVIDADVRLNALTEYALTGPRRKQYDQPIHELERAFLGSTNRSFGWIGTASLRFRSINASYLHQKSGDTKVSHLVKQQLTIKKT